MVMVLNLGLGLGLGNGYKWSCISRILTAFLEDAEDLVVVVDEEDDLVLRAVRPKQVCELA